MPITLLPPEQLSSYTALPDLTLTPDIATIPSAGLPQPSQTSGDVLSTINTALNGVVSFFGGSPQTQGAPITTATSQPLFNQIFGTPQVQVTATPSPEVSKYITIGLVLIAGVIIVLVMKR